MNIVLTKESNADYLEVEELIQLAFANEEFSDKNEHKLVADLRNSLAYIPELSIVARAGNVIVGHILFTKAEIVGQNLTYPILVLAPLAVHPEYQSLGIGSKLIRSGLELAHQLGYNAVSVMGHPTYYSKFGFTTAAKYRVIAPFAIPDEYFMLLELRDGCLNDVYGVVNYAPEFGC